MSLELQGVSRSVGGRAHIHPTSLTLENGTMNVLLGPTSAGKTSLMRLMAGLDKPTTGRILWQGADVTGQRVRAVRRGLIRYSTRLSPPIATSSARRNPSRGKVHART